MRFPRRVCICSVFIAWLFSKTRQGVRGAEPPPPSIFTLEPLYNTILIACREENSNISTRGAAGAFIQQLPKIFESPMKKTMVEKESVVVRFSHWTAAFPLFSTTEEWLDFCLDWTGAVTWRRNPAGGRLYSIRLTTCYSSSSSLRSTRVKHKSFLNT